MKLRVNLQPVQILPGTCIALPWFMDISMKPPVKAKEYFEAKLAFTLGPMELDEALRGKSKPNLIDVRASEDFAKSHIPGAKNLPQEKWGSSAGLDPQRPNVVYCYSIVCHLAARACAAFAAKGFPVMELEGRFGSWTEHGLSTETGSSQTTGISPGLTAGPTDLPNVGETETG